MARVEKQSALEDRLKEVKGDVVMEVRRWTRVRRPWLTCSLVVLVLFLGLCVWAAWGVAATGLIRVPLFTTLAFELPQPTRPVTPGVPAQTVFQETFTSTLTRRLYEGSGILEDRSIELLLSEGSLTASLRSFLEDAGLTWIETSGAQVVVDQEVGVELFLPFSSPVSDLQTAVKATFALEAEQGNLVVTPIDITLGSQRIPDVLVATFLKPFLETELSKLNAAMVGYAQISDVEVLPREVIISSELSVEIQESL
ncbi:hypothetical protein HY733_01125 [Candidatus Uhrbacteria bacterium]|nr:hypothetical protein [Candidatus Uhrbacteria bacterium]